MADPVFLDGSLGEGGGQVLRSALALSLITGRPLHMVNIRARRNNPGLQPQHLAAVEAAARISDAAVEGARKGSDWLTFSPATIGPGRYRIDIGTAGAVSLVIQTVALPLALQRELSELRITGGTSVPFAPTVQYLEHVWVPTLLKIGVHLVIEQKRAGYYPKGGGEVTVTIEPTKGITPLAADERGALECVEIWSYSSNLPEHVRSRQAQQAEKHLTMHGVPLRVHQVDLPAVGKGTQVLIVAHYAAAPAGFTALGAPGLPAERVADQACEAFFAHHRAEGAIEPHLADQLLLPLAFAEGPSRYTVSRITRHLLTNAEVIRRFVSRSIVVEGEEGSPGRVRIG